MTEVDIVYCVDGKFPDYDYPVELSDDGSRELVLSYTNTVLIDCPADEVTKRNRYLEACKESVAIMIDSDEYVLEADWSVFRKNCEKLPADKNLFGLLAKHTDGPGIYPRLFRAPQEMEYHRCHNFFRHKPTGDIFRSPSLSTAVEGLTLAWDDSLRKQDHIDRTFEYQKRLIEKEKPMKHILQRF